MSEAFNAAGVSILALGSLWLALVALRLVRAGIVKLAMRPRRDPPPAPRHEWRKHDPE